MNSDKPSNPSIALAFVLGTNVGFVVGAITGAFLMWVL